MIELGVFDLDGVISKESKFPKSQNSEEVLEGQKDNLDILNNFLREKNVKKIAVTGRSLAITLPILDYTMDDLSVCEHGTMIYNPKTSEQYHLADNDKRFSSLKRAKEVLEEFIEDAGRFDAELMKRYARFDLKRMRENLHILTYEFHSKEGDELAHRLYLDLKERKILPEEVVRYINDGLLVFLPSSAAIDIKPNISKADGLRHVIDKLVVKPERMFIAGDSYHSDFDMMEAYPEAMWICPVNSDDRLKWEISRKERGYVSRKPYFEGTMETLRELLD